MPILGSSDIEAIKNSIKEVTDTFFVTPVEYHQVGESLDRFNEDRGDTNDVIFNLHALVEFSPSQSSGRPYIINSQGQMDVNSIKVTLNYRDLIPLGVSDGRNETIINASKDYFIVHNKKYTIMEVYNDGPLDDENVLTVIVGKKDEVKS